jgi:pimeloyl-ACP methyl ester carboxylesterase
MDDLGDRARCNVGDTLQDHSLSEMAHRILAAAPATFVLAGLSMGGMVALEIMRSQPGRVTGLAIVDSNAFPDTPEQAEQRRRTIAAVRMGVDLRAAGQASLEWLVHPAAPGDVRDEIIDMGVRVGAEAYARQIEAVLHRPDQRPVLSSIKVPSLVIMGADDGMIPVSCAHRIATSIPKAELKIIPDCGHLPPIEKPRAVADLLRELISRASAHGSDQIAV